NSDRPTGKQAVELLAHFDSLLAGELPAELQPGDPQSAEMFDGSLRELCDFLLLMEAAWPRKASGRNAWQSVDEDNFEPGATRQLGRFRLLREIGRGGCGVVFLAEDPASEKRVALKVPNPAAMA